MHSELPECKVYSTHHIAMRVSICMYIIYVCVRPSICIVCVCNKCSTHTAHMIYIYIITVIIIAIIIVILLSCLYHILMYACMQYTFYVQYKYARIYNHNYIYIHRLYTVMCLLLVHF